VVSLQAAHPSPCRSECPPILFKTRINPVCQLPVSSLVPNVEHKHKTKYICSGTGQRETAGTAGILGPGSWPGGRFKPHHDAS
jgi:hypothetical protein